MCLALQCGQEQCRFKHTKGRAPTLQLPECRNGPDAAVDTNKAILVRRRERDLHCKSVQGWVSSTQDQHRVINVVLANTALLAESDVASNYIMMPLFFLLFLCLISDSWLVIQRKSGDFVSIFVFSLTTELVLTHNHGSETCVIWNARKAGVLQQL